MHVARRAGLGVDAPDRDDSMPAATAVAVLEPITLTTLSAENLPDVANTSRYIRHDLLACRNNQDTRLLGVDSSCNELVLQFTDEPMVLQLRPLSCH